MKRVPIVKMRSVNSGIDSSFPDKAGLRVYLTPTLGGGLRQTCRVKKIKTERRTFPHTPIRRERETKESATAISSRARGEVRWQNRQILTAGEIPRKWPSAVRR